MSNLDWIVLVIDCGEILLFERFPTEKKARECLLSSVNYLECYELNFNEGFKWAWKDLYLYFYLLHEKYNKFHN